MYKMDFIPDKKHLVGFIIKPAFIFNQLILLTNFNATWCMEYRVRALTYK